MRLMWIDSADRVWVCGYGVIAIVTGEKQILVYACGEGGTGGTDETDT